MGSNSNRSQWIDQVVVPRVSKELGNQFSTEINTNIERAVRQQLDALLPTVFELEI